MINKLSIKQNDDSSLLKVQNTKKNSSKLKFGENDFNNYIPLSHRNAVTPRGSTRKENCYLYICKKICYPKTIKVNRLEKKY